MAVIRCPECGRAADGVECLACGYIWTEGPGVEAPPKPAAAPAPAPAASPPVAPPPVAPPPSTSRPANPFASSTGHTAAPSPSSGTPTTGSLPKSANPFASGGMTNPFAARSSPTIAPPPPTAPAVDPFADLGTPTGTRDPLAPGTAPAPITGIWDGPPSTVPDAPTTPPAPDAPTTPLDDDGPGPEPARSNPTPAPFATPEPPVDLPPPLPTPRTRPPSAFARFLRSPLAYVAAGGGSFVVVLIAGLVFLSGNRDPLLARIDSGEARQVAEELRRTPENERSPHENLALGHALALLGQTDEALRAYHAAARRSVVDERALDYTIEALHEPLQEYPKAVLKDWPGPLADDKLREAARDRPWTHRHNALEVLAKRGTADDAIRAEVAIRDLLDPDRGCDDHRAGLRELAKVGRGEDAIAAVEAVRERMTEAKYACLAAELATAAEAIAGR